MKTKQTQVVKRIVEIDSIKQQVMKSIGATLLEYNTFLYDVGVALAEQSIKKEELIRMPEFWKWFRNEWYMFERDLIADLVIASPTFLNSEKRLMSLNNSIYKREMCYMIKDELVHASFHSFIKEF